MREILFRGKRVDNGEWVYGSYAFEPRRKGAFGQTISELDHESHYIVSKKIYEYWEVIPETVGEYTGLTDKNGKRVFEGDIIEVDRIYDTPQPRPSRFEVEWEESSGFFPLTVCRDGGDYFIDTDHCEVIGNIHDNPELLFCR